MVKDKFLTSKKARLNRKDKSSINSWDKPILSLCKKINKSNDYYTLSSCSGRIILIKETKDKQANLILFTTHEKITATELKKQLENIIKKQKTLIYLKQEPCVLAISCRNLEKQQELLNKARSAGWKKSGITTTSKKFILELFSTERIDVPIINKGKILVNDDYLTLITSQANSKLQRTWEKIKKLEKKV
jgi:tRNA wybutosine-synthesizing protein 3